MQAPACEPARLLRRRAAVGGVATSPAHDEAAHAHHLIIRACACRNVLTPARKHDLVMVPSCPRPSSSPPPFPPRPHLHSPLPLPLLALLSPTPLPFPPPDPAWKGVRVWARARALAARPSATARSRTRSRPGASGGGSERETTSNFETGVAARLLFQPGATGHKRRLPARCRQTPLPEFRIPPRHPPPGLSLPLSERSRL